MKRTELELEHHYKNRLVGRHRLPARGVRVVGSKKDADIHLAGEQVGPIHAIIEYQNGNWIVTDLGSEQGTWVEQNPIIEHVIAKPTDVHIGAHILRLIPREHERILFAPKDDAEVLVKGDFYHQVVLFKRGHVLETHLLPKTAVYKMMWRGQVHQFIPPSTSKWERRDLGDIVVQHRLVASEKVEFESQDRFSFGDPSVRKAVAACGVLFVLGILMLWFAPHRPNTALNAVKPEMNLYTKMIYDAQLMAEKRKEAMKRKKYIVGQNRQAPEANTTGNTEANKIVQQNRDAGAKGAKVISQIKAKQLGQLIGKISKRAALNSILVASQGESPDMARGRAGSQLTNGSLVDNKTFQGTGLGSEGHKLGKVGTIGKGGGAAQYKGLGGLAQGNVGNATVGVLEEETEIEGGLDRDVIARVIQSELGQIRYCYERQLSASPDLFGKVSVKFTIGGEGTVLTQSINGSTMQNAMVEGCILRRIAGWQFPKPKGGTQVFVTYPFLFRSTR